MVAPGFFVEAVVEVFVHVLLPVIVPRFWIGFKVVPIDFRDWELLQALVPSLYCASHCLVTISIPLSRGSSSFILLCRSGSGCSSTNILTLFCLFRSLIIFRLWGQMFCIGSVRSHSMEVNSLRLGWHWLLFFVVEESENVRSSLLLSLFWHLNYFFSFLFLELEFKTNRPKNHCHDSLLILC